MRMRVRSRSACGGLGHGLAVEPAEPAQRPLHALLPPQEDVGPDAQVGRQREVLVHGLDADPASLERRGERHRSCRPPGSCRRWAASAPDRMLTRVDLPAPLSPTRPTTSPGVDVEVDAPQRLYAAEVLGDPPHRHHRWPCTFPAGQRRGCTVPGAFAAAVQPLLALQVPSSRPGQAGHSTVAPAMAIGVIAGY